jgi:hypothetical protein
LLVACVAGSGKENLYLAFNCVIKS